ncbi:MAG: UDP-2,3-diacylglucosamine diphosphatase [Prevotellaceae bacterium]|jgi:UDP-2,3-diacylglucosamine hydrolase|nr:UDP-2,3-diacylglucosamine diphosphatase [Prevotellaceae bacterium]
MKNIYFISDAHLGSRLVANPREHEARLVRWLDSVKSTASTIYLLGDMFDFWFEYHTVVPKGYVRFLGKLAELVDAGIDIHFFIGNHDIWAFDYFEKEIGLTVHREPLTVAHFGKTFYLRHGDGVEGDDNSFQLVRKIFHNRFLQKCYMCVPPRLGQNIGYWWAKKSRQNLTDAETKYKGEDGETIVRFAKKYAETHPVDYLVFGHRHLLLNLTLAQNEQVIILGDFIQYFSYGKFDGKTFELKTFEEK